MKRLWAALAMSVALAAAEPSRADTPPTPWDLARDPGARGRWALHVTVRELIALDSEMSVRSVRSAALERARALLEDARAASSPDVRLRFDLGEVYEALGHHERAIEVLGAAIALEPDAPGVPDALTTLAYGYARLERSREERDAYLRYLTTVTDDRSRALALLNLAEAEMHLGNLSEAIARYREAFQLAASIPTSFASETCALAVWGLAVALDRAADPAGALEQAALALRMDPGAELIGHGANVFFAPEYERIWYLALAATVVARQASDPRLAAPRWGHVQALWAAYIASARSDDRWLARARSHEQRAHARKLAADKGARRLPPLKSPTVGGNAGDSTF